MDGCNSQVDVASHWFSGFRDNMLDGFDLNQCIPGPACTSRKNDPEDSL